jgi:hypothetical protein
MLSSLWNSFVLALLFFVCRQIGGIYCFLVFRTCFRIYLSVVKNVLFRFLSMFFLFCLFCRSLIFVLSLWFVCLLMGQWCFCLVDCMCCLEGSLCIGEGDAFEMYGCVRWIWGSVGSFCFAPTVACVSQTSFVFCC